MSYGPNSIAFFHNETHTIRTTYSGAIGQLRSGILWWHGRQLHSANGE